jgi:VanZ family protein
MSIFFRVLSAAYIAGIFLLADSPMVSDVATFNPCSLLHIPLYGILTLLLILSFSPQRKRFINSTNPRNASNSINLVVAGIIALVVAIADEIHQAYIPIRDASVTDVFLDIVGIILCMVIIKRTEHTSGFSKIKRFLRLNRF